MSLLFNTTNMTVVVFNGVTMEVVVHNKTTVFDDNAVFIATSYDMSQDLIPLGEYLYLLNTSVGAPLYNGKLCNWDGSPFTPTIAQYPKDYTLDLLIQKYIDTERVISPTEEIVITQIYDVAIGQAYKIYRIHLKGNGKADIYKGQNIGGVKIDAVKVLSDVDYTPPLTTWKIYEIPPTVIDTQTIEYNMDSFITV